jgi:hypothetical protein
MIFQLAIFLFAIFPKFGSSKKILKFLSEEFIPHIEFSNKTLVNP